MVGTYDISCTNLPLVIITRLALAGSRHCGFVNQHRLVNYNFSRYSFGLVVYM